LPRPNKALSKAAPTYLTASDFFKTISPDRRNRLFEIDAKFHEDTQSELSDVDYYNLATLQLMIEDIDRNIARAGGVGMVPPEMVTDQRKAKETIIGIMQKWREGKKAANSSLGSLKEAIIKGRTANGSLFTLEFKQPAPVIDITPNEVESDPEDDEIEPDESETSADILV
jgi:hypothetical protein